MMKFALTLGGGDHEVQIGTYSTKEEALKAGEELKEIILPTRPTLCCIQADFDENDQRTDNRYWLYKTWY